MNIKILGVSLLLFVGCAEFKTPHFEKIDSIVVNDISGNTVTLLANAHFKNPNLVGGTFTTDSIQVIINDIPVGTLSAQKEFKVPSKEQFTVPLRAVIPLEKIYRNKNSLSGLLNTLILKKIKVAYKGNLIYNTLGIGYTYPIDIKEEIPLKKK
jgi:LEA14-like dessication related protein